MLNQSFPNPFNPSTTIEYDLPEQSEVSLVVYDMMGREVQTLVSASQSPGTHTAAWSGTDQHGHQVPGGMYFARLRAIKSSSVVKLVCMEYGSQH